MTSSVSRSSIEAQIKLDMKLGINMDLAFDGKITMCKIPFWLT